MLVIVVSLLEIIPWCCNLFSLSVVFKIRKLHLADTEHLFNARNSDWGFSSFMSLAELDDPCRGYLVNDTLIVEAEVSVRRVNEYVMHDWRKEIRNVGLKNWMHDLKKDTGYVGPEKLMHDSKKETGYVGLKNQGATCYMNSLLQTLYHIPYFRRVSMTTPPHSIRH